RHELAAEADAASQLVLVPSVLLSTPGSVALVGDEPRARATSEVTTLVSPLRVRLPATLSDHLLAINEQTSAPAGRLAAPAVGPTWTALAARPLGFLTASPAKARGPRRALLPRAVLEAYRCSLVMAKLWEIGLTGGERRA